ncbi:hypothetical protein G7068_13700 [Leucobacter viscericola]|uniref:Uncharacterized protein n=1 Tax=Leucobacter viscericola TaxID=2714935 RepID=A0A6G7XHV6_9MICO|nr:hypothetical protein [Leucobacter viscericola]QIK64133.1 hypothetical protein G7068_13700 [Leucobacter viscericola]
MIARAHLALEANAVPPEDRHTRDLSTFEMVEVTGEGETWEAAKSACVIPENALIISWIKE